MCDVYLDDLFYLTKQINKRHLTGYKMDLLIAQNPHTKNPKDLLDRLENVEEQIEQKPREMPQFDAAGFESLKLRLQGEPGSRLIVKN